MKVAEKEILRLGDFSLILFADLQVDVSTIRFMNRSSTSSKDNY